jgi:hypothetical protein
MAKNKSENLEVSEIIIKVEIVTKSYSTFDGEVRFPPGISSETGIQAMEACVRACQEEALTKLNKAREEIREENKDEVPWPSVKSE